MCPNNLTSEDMYALHVELTEFLDGLTLEAVLFACATAMAHAYLQIVPEKREVIRASVDRFITKTIGDLDTCGQRAN